MSIFRPPPPLWLLAVIGLLFFSISLERLKIYWRIALAVMLAGILLFIALPPPRYQPGRLEAYFLDVGHGDAGIVVFPGGDALLIDGGGASLSDFQVGRRLLLPFILQKRIRVRWVAVSHFHPDHVKGVIELLAILAPEELWISSTAAENDLFRQLLAAKPKKTLLRKIRRGLAKTIDNCSVTCLAPPRFINSAQTANDHSMVLRVSDGRHGFLFSGDIEKNAEAGIAAATGPSPAATVLKVPHHGSRTSSTAKFLDLVHPQLAVISCPLHSSFGFPHREVIERLKQRNIRWLTTARRGGIMIASIPEGLEIEVSK